MKTALILLLVFLSACGKAPKMKDESKSSRHMLNGKSDDQIIALKYNSPFELKCSIRMLKGEIISLNVDPVDQFTLTLSDDLHLMRVLNYKVGGTEMIIVVKIASAPEILPHVTHRTENWKEYYMENTPILKIKYRRAPKKILSTGTINDPKAYSKATLYENIEKRLFTITSEVGNTLESDDFRCTLVTKIHPRYADQWKEVK